MLASRDLSKRGGNFDNGVQLACAVAVKASIEPVAAQKLIAYNKRRQLDGGASRKAGGGEFGAADVQKEKIDVFAYVNHTCAALSTTWGYCCPRR